MCVYAREKARKSQCAVPDLQPPVVCVCVCVCVRVRERGKMRRSTALSAFLAPPIHMYMRVYIYSYVPICIYICTYEWGSVALRRPCAEGGLVLRASFTPSSHIYMYIYVYVYNYTCVCTFVCIYIYICICTSV